MPKLKNRFSPQRRKERRENLVRKLKKQFAGDRNKKGYVIWDVGIKSF